MLDMKSKLIEDRRRAAAATKQQKDAIAKVMEEVRSNASKANKIITQALTGKITLASLTSTDDKKKKKPKRSKSAPRLEPLDQKMRPSHSAGDQFNDSSFKPTMKAESEQDSVKPYVSPYDANFANQTVVQ